MVRDQQTVVIGGLMRDAVTTTNSKIPLLGDIPLIGMLFRKKSSTKSKQNLLLFLTPYIVRSQADLRAIYERKMRERQEFLDRYFVFGTHDYHPTVDYSRTRGLVSEIMKQVETVQEDKDLAEKLASQPSPKHVARMPLGYMAPTSSAVEDDDTVIEGGQNTQQPAQQQPAPAQQPPAASPPQTNVVPVPVPVPSTTQTPFSNSLPNALPPAFPGTPTTGSTPTGVPGQVAPLPPPPSNPAPLAPGTPGAP